MLVDAFDIFMQAGVLAAMVKDKFTDTSGVAHFISSTFVGLAVGSVLSGAMADRLGRRSVYQFNLLLFGTCALLTSVAPSFEVVLILRFLMSIGLGGELVAGYSMMSEVTPAASRGRWGVTLSLLVNMAQPLSALAGLIVLPSIGWRWMFVIGGVPAFVVWYLRRSLPESPRWLMRQGKREEAENVLRQLWSESGAKEGQKSASALLVDGTPTLSWKSLFDSERRGRTAFCAMMLILTLSAQYGFLNWAPTLLVKSGASFIHSLGYTTIMAIGAPIGMIVGLMIIDRVGRKPLLMSATVLAACSGLAYAQLTASQPTALIVAGFLEVMLLQVCASTIFGAYLPELFPTEIRATGVGFSIACGRVAAALSPYGVLIILGYAEPKYVFVTFAAILLALTALVALAGPETKQRSLEEIAGDVRSPTAVSIVSGGQRSASPNSH
jgi:putative MFS transporter